METSTARVVSLSPDPARNGLPGETLLLIDIINAEGLVIIQTVWATTPDRGRGHRLTRFEDVADQATLIQRLAELGAVVDPRANSCRQEGRHRAALIAGESASAQGLDQGDWCSQLFVLFKPATGHRFPRVARQGRQRFNHPRSDYRTLHAPRPSPR